MHASTGGYRVLSDSICHFKEFYNDCRRPGSGRKRTANTSRNRKVIEKRVQRNLRVSMRQITRDMGISDRSNRVLKSIWTFQQDSASVYKVKKTQEWCKENFLDTKSPEE
ncbi:hypothetical protein TNCV_1943121 [Trichonephila clavipes]|nr:hypothetical protein TNCV_1943121 [Trichonephila clavipes]